MSTEQSQPPQLPAPRPRNEDDDDDDAQQQQQQTQKPKRQRAVVRNHNRGLVFRKWILETFPDAALGPSTHILDVAGGSGDIGIPLTIAGARVTIIDPRVCDFKKNHIVKNLAFHLEKKNTKTYAALKEKLGDALDEKGLPMPAELHEWFCAGDAAAAAGESDAMKLAKQTATLVVGLHPDEATDPIVDFALSRGLPCAVIPCCVFPRQNPHRKLKAGGGVQTYDDYVQYLLEKDDKMELFKFEDFDGRNVVIFHRGRKPQQQEEPAAAAAAAAAAE